MTDTFSGMTSLEGLAKAVEDLRRENAQLRRDLNRVEAVLQDARRGVQCGIGFHKYEHDPTYKSSFGSRGVCVCGKTETYRGDGERNCGDR